MLDIINVNLGLVRENIRLKKLPTTAIDELERTIKNDLIAYGFSGSDGHYSRPDGGLVGLDSVVERTLSTCRAVEDLAKQTDGEIHISASYGNLDKDHHKRVRSA